MHSNACIFLFCLFSILEFIEFAAYNSTPGGHDSVSQAWEYKVMDSAHPKVKTVAFNLHINRLTKIQPKNGNETHEGKIS